MVTSSLSEPLVDTEGGRGGGRGSGSLSEPLARLARMLLGTPPAAHARRQRNAMLASQVAPVRVAEGRLKRRAEAAVWGAADDLVSSGDEDTPPRLISCAADAVALPETSAAHMKRARVEQAADDSAGAEAAVMRGEVSIDASAAVSASWSQGALLSPLDASTAAAAITRGGPLPLCGYSPSPAVRRAEQSSPPISLLHVAPPRSATLPRPLSDSTPPLSARGVTCAALAFASTSSLKATTGSGVSISATPCIPLVCDARSCALCGQVGDLEPGAHRLAAVTAALGHWRSSESAARPATAAAALASPARANIKRPRVSGLSPDDAHATPVSEQHHHMSGFMRSKRTLVSGHDIGRGIEGRLIPLHPSLASGSFAPAAAVTAATVAASSSDWSASAAASTPWGEHVHTLCALWSAGVTVDAAGTLRRVHEAVSRASKTLCGYCGRTGASVPCARSGCVRYHHLRCLLVSGGALAHARTALCVMHTTVPGRGAPVADDGAPLVAASPARVGRPPLAAGGVDASSMQSPFPGIRALYDAFVQRSSAFFALATANQACPLRVETPDAIAPMQHVRLSSAVELGDLPLLLAGGLPFVACGPPLLEDLDLSVNNNAVAPGGVVASRSSFASGAGYRGVVELLRSAVGSSTAAAADGDDVQMATAAEPCGVGATAGLKDLCSDVTSLGACLATTSSALPFPDTAAAARDAALAALVRMHPGLHGTHGINAISRFLSPSSSTPPSPIFPVLRVGGCTVLRWGRLVTRRPGYVFPSSPNPGAPTLLVPVGFSSRRVWWGPHFDEGARETLEPRCGPFLERITYTCDVLDGCGPPLDTVDARTEAGILEGGVDNAAIAAGLASAFGPIFAITCDAWPALRCVARSPEDAFALLRVRIAALCGAPAAHFLSRIEAVRRAIDALPADAPTEAVNAVVSTCLEPAAAGVTRTARLVWGGENTTASPLSGWGWFGLGLQPVQAALEGLPDAVLCAVTPPGTAAWWPRHAFRYHCPSPASVAEAREARNIAAGIDLSGGRKQQAPALSASFSCSRFTRYNRSDIAACGSHHATSLLAASAANLNARALIDFDRAAMGDAPRAGALLEAAGEAAAAAAAAGAGPDAGGAAFGAIAPPAAVDVGAMVLYDDGGDGSSDSKSMRSGRGGGAAAAAAAAAAVVEVDAGEFALASETRTGAQFAAMRSWVRSEHLCVRRSLIHGWGLFTKLDVPRDAVLIEYAGAVVRQASADRREIVYEEAARVSGRFNHMAGVGAEGSDDHGNDAALSDMAAHFRVPLGRASDGSGSCYLFRLDDERITDATVHGCAARFINHRCEPNCYSFPYTSPDGERHILIRALRDLARGEELTYN